MKSGEPNFLKRIKVKACDGYHFIDPDKIIRIESQDRQLLFFTTEDPNPRKGLGKLNKLLELLDPELFFCCHRLHVVCINHMKKYCPHTMEIETTNGIVPLAQRRSKDFNDNILGKFPDNS